MTTPACWKQSSIGSPLEGRWKRSVLGDDSSSGPLGSDGHVLLLPASESERRARVVEWVRRGLERSEKVIYAEFDAGSAQPWLSNALGESGVDITAPGARGRLVVLPPAEFYAPGEQVDVVERALGEGYPAVRVAAEVSTASGRLAEGTYQAYEREVEKLCRTRPVSALCQYDRKATLGSQLAEAAAIHYDGVRDTLLQTSATVNGVALAGQVDASNARLLDAALRVAAASCAASLELDVAGLAFLDAAGCRVLLRVADELRARRARLVVVSPQPPVVRTLSVLELDRVPHIEVRERGPGP